MVEILLNRKTSNILVISQTSALSHRILTNTFQVSFAIKKSTERLRIVITINLHFISQYDEAQNLSQRHSSSRR